LCTREPEPCPFHDLTLTEALEAGKPVAYLIGTPAFCQTGTCAPALESMIDVLDRYGDAFTWVHAEVYTDNTATTPADAVEAANLSFEPSLFVINADGTVFERLDAVWDESELVEVLERALA
jgi:Zn-dependent oligopeptidase